MPRIIEKLHALLRDAATESARAAKETHELHRAKGLLTTGYPAEQLSDVVWTTTLGALNRFRAILLAEETAGGAERNHLVAVAQEAVSHHLDDEEVMVLRALVGVLPNPPRLDTFDDMRVRFRSIVESLR
ncbi:hypothetical protein PQ455_09510 [Sphingomonas naphthae]|uniref:TerB family tellurite resistance protein n=1 Tax=Sphingomonas naphthae TaxID=1813468 RepID=A0ABY7THH3_9SPHN|nr:hypothetical protein [Sphingomonas naphthae]WCT71890.1 hypothetical protein PQ455_09510 [Sphingomonas naphthae]